MNNTPSSPMEEDYILIGRDLGGMWLQPGFVEGIVREKKNFQSFRQVLEDVFRRNLEYAVILWNGLPVRLSYREDLPLMAESIVSLVEAAAGKDENRDLELTFETPNVSTVWKVTMEGKWVCIESVWRAVPGGYEQALNRLGMIRMPRFDMICEWKLLLQQFSQAITDSGARLRDKALKARVKSLKKTITAIPARGRFYRY